MENLDTAFSNLLVEGFSIEKAVQDVSDKEKWARTVDGIMERRGRLDVLFNNAGGGHFAFIEPTTLEQWRYVSSVNLDSVFVGMQGAIRVMKVNGGPIINNS